MKERLDVLLVRQGYARSREKAKAVIMSGNVFVNGQREDKAGTAFDETKIRIEVKGNALKYVSRGGLKLEKAIEVFHICLQDKICMDIGASTGGFTDCMLQNGAAKVYSVDVGSGQLDWKLRTDARVVCMEKTNFRYMKPEDIGVLLDFASVDVSFISLTKILIPAGKLLVPHGRMVCLIKPQFEAGKGKVGKKGVVREPEIHREVIEKVVDFADHAGFKVTGLEYSPIKGPEGNIEYLIYLQKEGEPPEETAVRAETETLPEETAVRAETEILPEETAVRAETETLPEETAVWAETETLPEETAVRAEMETPPEETAVRPGLEILPEDVPVRLEADSRPEFGMLTEAVKGPDGIRVQGRELSRTDGMRVLIGQTVEAAHKALQKVGK